MSAVAGDVKSTICRGVKVSFVRIIFVNMRKTEMYLYGRSFEMNQAKEVVDQTHT